MKFFKKKPYKNLSVYVTVRELREWLDIIDAPDDMNIRIGEKLMTTMGWHELTGVYFE